MHKYSKKISRKRRIFNYENVHKNSDFYFIKTKCVRNNSNSSHKSIKRLRFLNSLNSKRKPR